jgi:uncharacterized LabA/DUF88 family protein
MNQQTQELSFFMSKSKKTDKRVNTEYPVAILIDGGFFLKKYQHLVSKTATPKQVADDLFTFCISHVENDHLYRILYYDCNPLSIKIHNPLSKQLIDFGKTEIAIWRYKFFDELKRKRKVALRLGEIKTSKQWVIHPAKIKSLLKKEISVDDISHQDISLNMTQKGIDIKIGVDITSMAIKGNVRKIILISGDSDFVPAAKLARREGIDFILDPMRNNIDPTLFEHIDGLKTALDSITKKRKRLKK